MEDESNFIRRGFFQDSMLTISRHVLGRGSPEEPPVLQASRFIRRLLVHRTG